VPLFGSTLAVALTEAKDISTQELQSALAFMAVLEEVLRDIQMDEGARNSSRVF
jgi:hypothetical protein